ncbi:OmpA/MotB family protein [Rhodothermus bifroesti]|jgi:chemotaxis protein MotB|uniref:OmpA-like domain-containing protein n=1 Tax=Rhodothermus marinus TaxID=29549 RepID=A0A7V2B0E5_RHOMR|nr:flagellar motor protein MotB [Rhodothermus bifroesti]GBD01300.1 Motility protein B [bacterium HR18]
MPEEALNLEEEDDEEPSAPAWMTTFSDMATLLLTFFVMIVAMSEVEVKKFQEALSFFQGRTGLLQSEMVIPSIKNQVVTQQQLSQEQAQKYEELLKYLEENNLAGKVQVNLTDRGLHLIITDSVMFRSGEAELIEPSRTILRILAGMIDSRIQSVVVEGHTDNVPISTTRYPSNWELSAARAAAVVRFLLEQTRALSPERYLAVGYGEFHPRAPNDTPEGRARNRRVEILFNWEPWQNETNPYLKRQTLPTR